TPAHSASRSMKLRWLLLQFLAAPLTAQVAPRPFQATDYYRLTFVGEPRLAPDARRVAFTVTTVVEDKDRRHSEIWMAATDGSAPAFRYTSPATEASSPVWSADGTLLAFASKREGFDDDVWFLRTGTPGGEAFQIRGVHALPLFSPDGKSLLYGWRGAEPDSLKQQAWRSRVSPLAITRGPDVKRFDGRVYTSLPLVEDERGLVAPRETRRPRHLYLVPPSGGEPSQLTDGDLSQIDSAWSPDGRVGGRSARPVGGAGRPDALLRRGDAPQHPSVRRCRRRWPRAPSDDGGTPAGGLRAEPRWPLAGVHGE